MTWASIILRDAVGYAEEPFAWNRRGLPRKAAGVFVFVLRLQLRGGDYIAWRGGLAPIMSMAKWEDIPVLTRSFTPANASRARDLNYRMSPDDAAALIAASADAAHFIGTVKRIWPGAVVT